MFPGEVLNSNSGQAKLCLSSSVTKAAWVGMRCAPGLKLSASRLEAINFTAASARLQTGQNCFLLPCSSTQNPKDGMMLVRHLKMTGKRYPAVEQIKAVR